MTAVVGVLLALVPSLTLLAEPSLPAAVLALALAALCAGRARGAVLRLPVTTRPPRTSYGGTPVVSGRVTDPDRHPLRPRAPGTA
ncbi:hypothetical protein [uncultured Nocardioides sp.]|uniref:hypothetical protein n=1 Tax=uncultured Nocardioides sp. TaxID=198441 RepID=UPI002611A125|nr:hypothetical protein [uncultured Nocardioides sp.]